MSADKPRVVSPNRNQLLLQPTDLEKCIPDDHPARGVWRFVESLDLSAFYDEIKARGSDPGRPATDPKVLLSLWVYANSEGVGSARQLAELCERDAPYQLRIPAKPIGHSGRCRSPIPARRSPGA
jgi:transposase